MGALPQAQHRARVNAADAPRMLAAPRLAGRPLPFRFLPDLYPRAGGSPGHAPERCPPVAGPRREHGVWARRPPPPPVSGLAGAWLIAAGNARSAVRPALLDSRSLLCACRGRILLCPLCLPRIRPRSRPSLWRVCVREVLKVLESPPCLVPPPATCLVGLAAAFAGAREPVLRRQAATAATRRPHPLLFAPHALHWRWHR